MSWPIKIGTRREGDEVRVVCEIPGFQTNPFVGFAEWLNIQGIIAIIRSTAGADWCPPEITFIPRGTPSDAALEAYGSDRILTVHPFSRAFRRLTGMSPRDYRRSGRVLE
jgi:hypothetical protein